MKEVFVIADNIYSPLGSTSAENFAQLSRSVSGVQLHSDTALSPTDFYAALFSSDTPCFSEYTGKGYTKFEQLLIASITDAVQQAAFDCTAADTALIISSTKGNISLLEGAEKKTGINERIALSSTARKMAAHFGFVHRPLVISNACISGILAIVTGMRMIRAGKYKTVVVTGADLVSKFILSGFQSFQAVSDGICKPFDAARKGINLGEGAATVILSASATNTNNFKVVGGSVSNDANHISGPSRTGEELAQAITNALKDADLPADAIDFISTHGTATIYNDEMEAKAINLANLQQVPVNSLKPFYGHTLGAAGLIESVITLHSMQHDTILPTPGFEQPGVSVPVKVSASAINTRLQHCLKTASGFGGCNAAVVFSKQSRS